VGGKMPDIKESLKAIVKKFKKRQTVEPEGSRRIKKVQEAARQASKEITTERE